MNSDPILFSLNLLPLCQLGLSNWPELLSVSLCGQIDTDLIEETCNGGEPPIIERLRSIVASREQASLASVGEFFETDEAAWFAIRLCTYTDTPIGDLVLQFAPGTVYTPVQFKPFVELIVSDYQLNMELDSATMELTDRYEELNLIYGTDDNAEQGDQGQTVLASLVLQCAERMNVNTTILLLPDQDIFIVEQDEAANMAQLPVEHLAHDVFMPWITAVGDTIIINDEFDAELELNCPDISHKLLLTPILGYEQSIRGYIGVFNPLDCPDFTNSDRNLLQILSRKASRVVRNNYDELTGLANKTSFDIQVTEYLAKSVDEEAALLVTDLRGVHIINESAGNDAGDGLIREVGQLIAKQFANDGIVARIEGNLFAVVLPRINVDSALHHARKLLASINAMNFTWHGAHIHTNASIGLVPLDAELGGEEAMSTAKIAVQLAGEKGNNVIELQRPDNTEISMRKERMGTLNTIHAALEGDHFELFCQGIYPTHATKHPHHYEILLRLHDDAGNFISPDQFIPAAEYYKVMPDIDRWVIRNTLQTLSNSWHILENTQQSWAINLSGQTFSQPGLMNFISEELAMSGIPASMIAFEVTETVAVDDLDSARKIIEQVQALGCEFYLDDFGTGLSSFTYLQALPFDYVKIDGSFIKDVVGDEVAQAMVKAISDVAHVLGMKTVAEYVENDAIVEKLKTLGVEYLQGYGLHKPTALHSVLTELQAWQHSQARA
ncbi:MAG: putative bifunctional diguanylate cyclase/phosphodiesterase [Pseudomonadales bacterium]